MKKPIIICGPQGSGKTRKAQEIAARCGSSMVSAWAQPFRFPPSANALIIEEVPHPDLWPTLAWRAVQYLGAANPELQIILVLNEYRNTPIPHDCFDVIDLSTICTGCGVAKGEKHQAPCVPVVPGQQLYPIFVGNPKHRGGPGRGQGRHRSENPRSFISTQRYTEAELKLLEKVAGGAKVGEFIHDAALDRAQQFANEGVEDGTAN